MKKFLSFFYFILLSSISFFGCKNFMDSDGLLDELNKAVEYANAPYANIEIKTDARATLSMIPTAGKYNNLYKVSDSISLSFEENDDYSFVGWKSTPENSIFFENTKERSTKATILSAEENIIIEPCTVLVDTLTVNFVWEEGSVSVPNTNSFKINEEFSFRYNSIPDYAFIGWKVYDIDGNECNDVLELSVNGLDVKAKVLKVNKEVTVKAITSKRPKVVSNSPLFSSDGVNRDRRIVIMFDQDMDESSIYFDENEQEKLKGTGCTLIFDNAEKRKDKCYAYKDKEGNLYWKNIKIELRKVGDSYLEFYNAPYFDETDKSVLYIDPIIDNPPPGGTEILVTVSQKMFSKSKIELASECSWSYFTNGSIDIYGPEFGSNFKVTFKGDDNHPQAIDIKNTDKYPDILIPVDQVYMKFEGEYVDNGSGAGDLWYEVVQVESPYYAYDVNNQGKLPSGKIETEKTKMTATIKNPNDVVEIDTREYKDGIYRIDIKAKDLNERVTLYDKQYYFIKDKTYPGYVDCYFGSLNNGAKFYFDLNSEKDSCKDIKKIVISGQENETILKDENDFIERKYFKQNSNGKNWNFTVTFIDYAGLSNDVDFVVWPGVKAGYFCVKAQNGDTYFYNPKQYENAFTKIRVVPGEVQGIVVAEDDEWIEEDVRIVGNSFYCDNIYEQYSRSTNKFFEEREDGFAFYEDVIDDLLNLRNYPLYYFLYWTKNDQNSTQILWYVPSIKEIKTIIELNSKSYKYQYTEWENIDFSGKKVISCYIDKNTDWNNRNISYYDFTEESNGKEEKISLHDYKASNFSHLLMGRVEMD